MTRPSVGSRVEGRGLPVTQQVALADEALERAASAGRPAEVLYRGERVTPERLASLTPGTTFTHQTYVSTSRNPAVASFFSEAHHGDSGVPVVYELLSRRGTDVSGASLGSAREVEVLLPRESVMRVEAVGRCDYPPGPNDPEGPPRSVVVVQLTDVSSDADLPRRSASGVPRRR